MAHMPPGALTGFGRALREPVGPIHWAGTETSTVSHGSFDGAIRSGDARRGRDPGGRPRALGADRRRLGLVAMRARLLPAACVVGLGLHGHQCKRGRRCPDRDDGASHSDPVLGRRGGVQHL